MIFSKTLSSYCWKGTNKDGAILHGVLEAPNALYAKSILRSQGIHPKRIRRCLFQVRLDRRAIPQADLVDLTYQLATLFSAGLSLTAALNVIASGHANPNLRALLNAIKADLATGASLSQALKKRPRFFNALFCNLIATGEESGTLEVMLHNLVVYQEKSRYIHGKIMAACLYPSLVMLISTIVTSALLIFVIPQFERLFSDFGAQLPAYTQFIVAISHGLRRYGWLGIIPLTVLTILVTYLVKSSPRFQAHVQAFTLRLPILGSIFNKAIIARLTRTLAITTQAGLPLVDALKSSANVTTFQCYRHGVTQILEGVSIGQSLHHSMLKTGLFPGRVTQLIASGEESGRLSEMLEQIAKGYENEIERAVETLSRLLEPAIMVILGILIGGLTIGMYLPVFQMASVF